MKLFNFVSWQTKHDQTASFTGWLHGKQKNKATAALAKKEKILYCLHA